MTRSERPVVVFVEDNPQFITQYRTVVVRYLQQLDLDAVFLESRRAVRVWSEQYTNTPISLIVLDLNLRSEVVTETAELAGFEVLAELLAAGFQIGAVHLVTSYIEPIDEQENEYLDQLAVVMAMYNAQADLASFSKRSLISAWVPAVHDFFQNE